MKLALLALAAGCVLSQDIQTLSAQLQKAPSADLYMQRGSAYLDAGDFRQAIADFDRALEWDAVNGRALAMRSRAYAKLSRYQDAITDLSGAIALAPGDAALFLERADAYSAAGDQSHAIADREEALRLSPEIYTAWINRTRQTTPSNTLSTIAVRETAPNTIAPLAVPAAAGPPPSQPAAAREATAKLPPLTTGAKPAAKPEAAQLSPVSKAPSSGTESVSPAPPKSVESADTYYQRARTLLNQGNFKAGLPEIDRALALQPSNPVYLNTRGFGYYIAKDYKRAIADFNEAIRINPNYLNAVHNRAMAKKNSGDTSGYEADSKLEAEIQSRQAKQGR